MPFLPFLKGCPPDAWCANGPCTDVWLSLNFLARADDGDASAGVTCSNVAVLSGTFGKTWIGGTATECSYTINSAYFGPRYLTTGLYQARVEMDINLSQLRAAGLLPISFSLIYGLSGSAGRRCDADGARINHLTLAGTFFGFSSVPVSTASVGCPGGATFKTVAIDWTGTDYSVIAT